MRMAIAPGIHIVTMHFVFARMGTAVLAQLFCGLVGSLLLFSPNALAHDHHGPPARIITDEQVGPWTISAWIQQHMDTGRFFVKVRSSSGTTTVLDDLKVEIGVQPAGQNSAVTFYPASSESPDGQYSAELPFDTEQSWQVKVRLQSSHGVNEITTYIGPSAPGSGQWHLLLYSVPFLSVGGLWLRVYWLRRGVKRRLMLTYS
jgi:hypothetical protein